MVIGGGGGVGEDLGDAAEIEVEFPVEQDLLQPAQVVRRVEPVPGCAAAAGFEQADLVVVVQGPDRDAVSSAITPTVCSAMSVTVRPPAG